MSAIWASRPGGATTYIHVHLFAVLLYASGFLGHLSGFVRSSTSYVAATRFKPNDEPFQPHRHDRRLSGTVELPTDSEGLAKQHSGMEAGITSEEKLQGRNVASYFETNSQRLRQPAGDTSEHTRKAPVVSQLLRPERRRRKELFEASATAESVVGPTPKEQISAFSGTPGRVSDYFVTPNAERTTAQTNECAASETGEKGASAVRADATQTPNNQTYPESVTGKAVSNRLLVTPFSEAPFSPKTGLTAVSPPVSPVSSVVAPVSPVGATLGTQVSVSPPLPESSGTAVEAASKWEELSRQHQQLMLARSLTSVIKLFVDFTHPDHLTPWQMQPPRRCTGSAFVVDDRLLLTNGHLVDWQTRVLARRHGNARKFKASVVAVGHDCDLALLTVDNEEFWEGLRPLAFGQIPQLRDTVTLLGYPTGGDQLSITEGVVSRVGMSKYVHSSYELLTVQIDAAINPGNSGGPALVAGRVVGVAFQGFSELQSVGYIVPYPVIRHFLNDLALHKRFTGFPTLGIKVTNLENQGMKEYKKLVSIKTEDLPPGITPTGVVVVEVDTLRKERYLKGLLRLPFASTTLPPEAQITRLLAEDPSRAPEPLPVHATSYLKKPVAILTPDTAVSHAALAPPLGTGATLAVSPSVGVAETGATTEDQAGWLQEGLDQRVVPQKGQEQASQTPEESDKRHKKAPTSENDLIVPNVHYNAQQALDEEHVGLKVGDVLLAIDNIDVADDGTVPFRDMERNQLEFTLMNRFNGEGARALVLRDGELMNIFVPLTAPNLVIPPHTWEMKPKYFVFGGLVFVQLTKSLVEHARHMEIPAFAYAMITRMTYQEKEKDEIIVLSVILPSELTIGYSHAPSVVRKVQGHPVRSFEEMIQLVECEDPFIEFIVEVEACKELPIVIDRKKAVELRQQIQDQHGISRDRSSFL